MRKLMFVDTETTGVDREKSGVWQIGGVIECGKRGEEFLLECDVFEHDAVDSEAARVNGLTPERLSAMQDPGAAHDQLVAIMDRYVDRYDRRDKFFMVNFRVDFDEDMLVRWFKNNDDDYFFSWFWHPGICVMHAAAWALRGERDEMKNFRLSTVAARLGVEFDEGKAHNALYDAKVAREMYYRLSQGVDPVGAPRLPWRPEAGVSPASRRKPPKAE